MADEQQKQKRQTAYKTDIGSLSNGTYVKESGWEPSYVLADELKISRVNIICTIINKEEGRGEDVLLDDGTGRIHARSFDTKRFESFNVGDVVNVIGRVREFNDEIYLMPEIVKKINDPKLVALRIIELQAEGRKKKSIVQKPVERLEEEVVEEPQLITMIRQNDKGDGVDISDLGEDAERQLLELKKKGFVYEIKPGRFKVLE